MSKFQIGDVVTLASGGMKRTITEASDDSLAVIVTWEDKDGNFQHDEFDSRALKKVD